MLIVALVLAVVGLAALVTAVVTSNELVAWVCIAASVLGVILLIVDAIRERSQRDATPVAADGDAAAAGPTVDDTYQNFDAEYPDEAEPEAEAEPEPEAHTEVVETEAVTASEPEAEAPAEPEPEPEIVEETAETADPAPEHTADEAEEEHKPS